MTEIIQADITTLEKGTMNEYQQETLKLHEDH